MTSSRLKWHKHHSCSENLERALPVPFLTEISQRTTGSDFTFEGCGLANPLGCRTQSRSPTHPIKKAPSWHLMAFVLANGSSWFCLWTISTPSPVSLVCTRAVGPRDARSRVVSLYRVLNQQPLPPRMMTPSSCQNASVDTCSRVLGFRCIAENVDVCLSAGTHLGVLVVEHAVFILFEVGSPSGAGSFKRQGKCRLSP